MATPQSPDQMAAAIDAVASQRMGVEPQQQAPAPAPQGEQKQEPKDTSNDKVAEKGSPETEGDKVSADAVVYEIDFGEGNNRKLTPQQIKSTFERYSAMNYKNAQYKPVMDLVEQIMRENPGINSRQMAEQMQNIYKAQQSNPQMGNTEGRKSGDKPVEDMDSVLKKWEEENAASLPPGYKEMMSQGGQGMTEIKQQLAQTQAMLRQVMAQSAGVADAARQGMQQTQGQKIDAVRAQIGNNIDRVQQALQLPDDKANDFMVFAAERGFTLEDFVDPQLTVKVMQDFKNNMDSTEMERMRGIAQRRQAFTGSLGSTPGAGGATEAPQESTFDRFASSQMSKRGM